MKKYKTYQEWNDAGYFVIKGEKAQRLRKWTGEPLFSREQVSKRAELLSYEDEKELDTYFGLSVWDFKTGDW